MTLPSDWKVGRCLEWCTDLPYKNRHRESPVFILQDTEFYFQFLFDDSERDYYIYLKPKITPKQFRPFQLTTYAGIEKANSMELQTCSNVCSSPVSKVWSTYESSIQKILKLDLEDGNFMKFLFVFHSLEGSSTTLQFLKTETEHKSVQADLSLMQPDLEYLSLDFNELLDSAAHPDVQVKCDGGIVHAHRAILTARSKVFSTMLSSDMKENRSGVVDMTHVDIPTMGLFLKFVYSGKILDLPIEMAPCLYTMGDQYQVFSLKRMCADVMLRNVSEDNCTTYLALSDLHRDTDFKYAVIDYITDHTELLKNDSWLKFSAEHTKLAFEVYQKYIEKSGQA